MVLLLLCLALVMVFFFFTAPFFWVAFREACFTMVGFVMIDRTSRAMESTQNKWFYQSLLLARRYGHGA